ncbi:hypothetical protein DPMN_074483 [Dreissena polymorpha]|uniref:Exonuclease domain-containing protein n=1 Tax=Dreissena polymorpha TaxID=45954 RepID=A0A9D4BNF0_DREPO|nr:hypothetical protein DPMN_074483 [Dreissena polymorpha]
MEKMEPKRKNPLRKKKCVENPQRKLERVQHKKPTLVIIDLETTGLIDRGFLMPHITQLAVKEIETEVSFSVYVMPKMITAKAGELTGISVD